MESRVRKLNTHPPRSAGQVLYWMRHNRRLEANHSLVFAAQLANRLGLPLQIIETHAPDRFHAFVLEGVPETAAAARDLGIAYGFQSGSVPQARSAAIVTDDYPESISPMPTFDVEAYAVDSSCIVPMATFPTRLYAAYSMRPRIAKVLPQFLKPVPPVRIDHRTAASPVLPKGTQAATPFTRFRGGRTAALRQLQTFLDHRLSRYSRDKNEPSVHATSDLSPYLHYGYISSLEVALAVRSHAAEHKLIADEFLEELIVRRELAFNFAHHTAAPFTLDVLPDWAGTTLAAHRHDIRDPLYHREQFESAATYDNLWNATQKELRLRGKIHGYCRMYWGKKILEWSASPEEALATMICLNDRYALDGRDPNTYANILWCFGLHDRPWPERPIYGKVRSMVRQGMERKTDVSAYVREIDYLEQTGKEVIT